MVVIDKISNFGWTVPLKNENAEKKTLLKKILISSKRKRNFTETDRCKEFYNSIFQNFWNNKKIKHYLRNTSLGAVLAEKFIRTIRDLLKWPVFERGNSNLIDVLHIKTRQYISRVHTWTKLTPIQASLKKNEGFVYRNLLGGRKKNKTKVSNKRSRPSCRFKENFFKRRYE